MNLTQSNKSVNLSHSKQALSFEEVIDLLKKKVIQKGDLPHVTVEHQLHIIDQFSAFPLGKYILERRGANGFWTDYMVSYPTQGKITGKNIEGKPFSPMEDFFLNKCPIVVAHQGRFQIFQKLAQKFLKDHAVLASIPCGLMRDLLTLNYSQVTNCQIIGIDIDKESLQLAEQLAQKQGIDNVTLIQQDAWNIEFNQELDIITSSGLNVYESDPEKVLELYRRFYNALKPTGKLIISVLTHPPGENRGTDWILDGISSETLLLDQILHKDILDIKWRNFRSSSELDIEFKKVGFSKVSIYFDKHRVFPTILAEK